MSSFVVFLPSPGHLGVRLKGEFLSHAAVLSISPVPLVSST